MEVGESKVGIDYRIVTCSYITRLYVLLRIHTTSRGILLFQRCVNVDAQE